MKIYVASSWRNTEQPHVVKSLRDANHEVYDFKDSDGFHWSNVDPEFKGNGDVQLRGLEDFDKLEDFRNYRRALMHPVAQQGFSRDFEHMEWADAFVLVLPCGRSAHLEAGWAIGKRKPTCVFMPDFDGTWDLMYLMADLITDSYAEMWSWASGVGARLG